jgi:prepilin-type processing-associated H-X9-DG protein
MARPLRQRAPAFSVVELLVVIGIIAVLLAVLVPALGNARRQAAGVLCVSNVRQLTQAFLLYANENKGRGPIYRTSSDEYWIDLLRAHYGQADQIRFCPSTQEGHVGVGHGSSVLPWVWGPSGRDGSYGFNGWLYRLCGPRHPEGPEADGGVRFSRGPLTFEQAWGQYLWLTAQDAARVPVFGDCSWANAWPRDWEQPPADLNGPGRDRTPPPNEPMLARYTLARHGRAISVSFLDGHAESVPLARLKELKWHQGFRYDNVDWPQRLPKM